MDIIKAENLSMSHSQFMLTLPYFLMFAGGMLTMLVGVSRRFAGTWALKGVTLATIVAAIYSISNIWGEPGTSLFSKMLAADYFSNLFNVIFLVATALVALASFKYLIREGIDYAEYYSLLLFACFGMMLLASALDLIVFFIALEIMSIAVYVLVGFRRADVKSNESALKYFILGSAASAVFLYGVALVYGGTGSMNIHEISNFFKTHQSTNTLTALGLLLIVVGLLFKVAAVPFHMWMPDVYEGAPTTITSFMTTGLKAAAFAAFLRVFVGLGYMDALLPADSQHYRGVLWISALLTMFIGNIVALTQRNIKRMLAYSSIAHTGYLLVGILAGSRSESGYGPVVVYIMAYVVMNLGAFGIVSALADRGDHYTELQDFSGLGFKRPVLGFAMMIFMLSMAGVPPTAGFIGKYLIFNSAIQAGEISLTILAVLCSAISAYYYLRVIVYMYMREPVRDFEISLGWSAAVVVGLSALMTIQFGVSPSILIHAATKAVMSI